MTTAAPGEPLPLAPLAMAPLGNDGWQTARLCVAAGLVVVLIGHAATVETLIGAWQHSALYRTAMLVPPALLYVLWQQRRRLTATPPRPTWIGVLAAAAVAGMWITAEAANINAGRQYALISGVAAIVLAAVGWRATARLLPFLAMLAFLVPTGHLMLAPLKHVAVFIVEGFGAVTGLPVETQAFVIHVGTHRYVVIDDCAGLPFVWTGLFLGLFFALLLYRTPWRIAALTLTGGLLGIAANSLRIIAILVADWIDGTQMPLAGHVPYQWATLGVTVALMLALVALLRPDAGAPAHAPAAPAIVTGGPPRLVWAWPVAAAALIAAVPHLGIGAANRVALPTAAPALPASVAGWTRTETAGDWRPAAEGAVIQASAAYGRGDDRITVFIVEAASAHGKVSGDAIDLIGGGDWMTADAVPAVACAGAHCVHAQHLKLVLRRSPRVRHVYSTFTLGARLVASPVALRLRRGWMDLIGRPMPARLIAVATDHPGGLPSADVAAILDTLTRPGG